MEKNQEYVTGDRSKNIPNENPSYLDKKEQRVIGHRKPMKKDSNLAEFVGDL